MNPSNEIPPSPPQGDYPDQPDELFAKAFRLSPDSVVVTRASDRTVINANEALCRMWGGTLEGVIGKPTKEFSVWVSDAEREEFMAQLLRDGEVLDWETDIRLNDSRLVRMLVSSRILTLRGEECILSVLRDVTEKRRAQALVRAQESLLQVVFDSMAEGVAVLGAKLNIVHMNPAFRRLLGVPASVTSWFEVMAGLEVFLPDGRTLDPDQYPSLRGQRGDFVQNFAMGIRRPGLERELYTEITTAPTAAAGDGTPQFVLTVRDVTERRRAERAVRELNADLERRVRDRTAELEAANRELEAFSYSISHDLRAPLRSIDGFAHAVVEDYAALLPEDGRRFLRTIGASAQRMGALIDDLLKFSRLGRQPLACQAVEATEQVRMVLAELLKPGAAEVVVGSLPPYEGDPALVRQVWSNLISNALKYSAKRAHPQIEVGCVEEPGARAYFVRDNGAGFDMRYAHKLFGVFQRLHRADEYEGTGVGLAVAQRIVHRHGGRIWAEAELDRGATFYFTLAAPVPPAEPAP